MRRLLIVLLIALVVAGVGYGIYRSVSGGEAGGMHGMGGPATVSVAAAIGEDITQWSEFSGRLEAVDIAEVRPRVSGVIEKIYFGDGDYVKKGQPLFSIDPRPYQAEVERARGQLAAAEAAAVSARAQRERALKLMDARAISKREQEDATAGALSAEGNVKAARAALDTALLNVEYSRVLAPISGKASRAEITVGNNVNAGPGAPLLTTIVALSPIYASFDVDEQTYLARLRGIKDADLKKIPVQVGLASEEGTPNTGHVDSFDNRLGDSTGTIRVRGVLQNADKSMVPGLFARVRLGSVEKMPAVLINDRAVGTDQAKKFVYVMGDGNIPEFREVTLGAMVDGLRVVNSGLRAGEKVVVNGTSFIMPKTPVNPQEVDMRTLKGADGVDPLAPPAPPAEAK